MKKYQYTLSFEAEDKNFQDFMYALELMAQAWVKHGKIEDYSSDIQSDDEEK